LGVLVIINHIPCQTAAQIYVSEGRDSWGCIKLFNFKGKLRIMKKAIWILALTAFLDACHENDTLESEFTGNESTYALHPGSTYDVSGTVNFKEKKDGTTLIRVTLSGTEGDLKHPVHLHYGNISAPDADIAAVLTPVMAQNGISETGLSHLSDETPVTYHQLMQYAVCIKVHLAEAGPDRDIILAGGNVGVGRADDGSIGGRTGMQVCKSE
jgi:hypothetical protein